MSPSPRPTPRKARLVADHGDVDAVEGVLEAVKEQCAIVLITHSMMAARQIAGRVAFFDFGRLVEVGPTEQVFVRPRSPRCAAFIKGRFG